MDPIKPTCSIRDDSPRAADWQKVFGRTTQIPITSWLPTHANLPVGRGVEVYMLDLDRITPDERQRLIEHLAGRFDIPRTQIEEVLDQGCPLLADDVIVAIPLRLLL